MNFEDLTPDQQAKINESRKATDIFMGKYKKDHAVCPKCNAIEHSTTLAGFPIYSDNLEAYEDKNTCVCSKCYDIHTCHERVPVKSTIKFIDGDLVRDSDQYEVILHGCNCFNTMGSGIALQMKNKFPQAYAVDCKTKKGDRAKLGTISYTTDTTPIIVNCYSQYDFKGRRVGIMDCDYMAIKTALQAVRKTFTGKKIGMPKIGSQLAGGDWNVIIRIVQEILEGEDVTVITWVP